jgi:hypothetical protein
MLRPLGFYEGMFIVSAILFNLLIAGIFIADKRGSIKWIRILGTIWLLLALPLGVVFAHYILEGAQPGMLLPFGLVFLYMLVELVLDYIIQYDFRKRWLTHIPYIILEYLALFSLIRIATQIDRPWSWVVGGSFWILLASLIYLIAGRRKTSGLPGTPKPS